MSGREKDGGEVQKDNTNRAAVQGDKGKAVVEKGVSEKRMGERVMPQERAVKKTAAESAEGEGVKKGVVDEEKISTEDKKRYDALFATLDRNKDGTVDFAELVEAFKEMGVPKKSAQVRYRLSVSAQVPYIA